MGKYDGRKKRNRTSNNLKLSSIPTSRVIFYGIIAIIVFTPLLFTPVTAEITQIKTTFFQFTILFLSVFWAFQTVRRSSLQFSFKGKNLLFYALIAFFSLLIISYLLSPYKYASFEELMRYASYFALYFIITMYVVKRSHVNVLLAAICLTTAVSTVYGLCQKLGYDFILWDARGRIFSTFGHPNFFANYLVIIIPTLIGVFIAMASPQMFSQSTKKRDVLRIFLLILITFSTLCLLFTLSRGAFLGLVMACPFFTIIGCKISSQAHTKKAEVLAVRFGNIGLSIYSQCSGVCA